LYHCSGQPLCSGYLFLLSSSDLNLHDLQGDRSSASADSGVWSSYLLAPASSASPIGDSQQYTWVWLWVYRPTQGVAGAASPAQLPAPNSAMASCSEGQLSPNSFIWKGNLAQISTVLREVRRGSSGGQAWRLCSVRFASLYPLSLRPTKVCATFLYSLLLF